MLCVEGGEEEAADSFFEARAQSRALREFGGSRRASAMAASDLGDLASPVVGGEEE